MYMYTCIYIYIHTHTRICTYIYIYREREIERERERDIHNKRLVYTQFASSHSKNSLSKICSKGWVALQGNAYTICDKNFQWLGPKRPDPNLGLRTGCSP